MLEFFKRNTNLSYILILLVLGLIFLFLGLGSFPLIDVDETRYATMARDMLSSGDWSSLVLNGTPFLEKPPLYFWLVAASVSVFGDFTPFAVRFPIALMSLILVFATYFLGKRVVSEKFGFYSAAVLLSSFFFLMLSHIAILDSLLTVFIALAIYSGFMATICKPEHQKWFWAGFYVSMGLGVLDKGVLALCIPIIVMFLYLLCTKNLKQLLKPIHCIGLFVFLLIVVPWHYAMHKEYGSFFWIEYLVRHHLARFINSETIGRQRPLLYFIPVFLAGFMPWMLLSIDMIFDGIKKICNRFKEVEGKWQDKLLNVVKTENDTQKLVLLAAISFCLIFTIFSISSTKLPTYILPIFPFAALLMGHYWNSADTKGEHIKPLIGLSLVLAGLFIFVAIAGSIACIFLPQDIMSRLEKAQILALAGLSLSGMLLTLRVKSEKIMSLFASYIIIMIFITMAAITKVTNIVYMAGENELVQYSTISSSIPNSSLVTFDFAVKPSVKINNNEYVDFITEPDFNALDKLLGLYANRTVFVIIKNKSITDEGYMNELEKRLELLNKGYKYSLYIKP